LKIPLEDRQLLQAKPRGAVHIELTVAQNEWITESCVKNGTTKAALVRYLIAKAMLKDNDEEQRSEAERS